MNEQKMRETADRIYSEHYGHLDDVAFAATKTQEIVDWLSDGDTDGATTEQLVAEWAEYDEEEIARQAPFIPAPPRAAS